MLVCSCAVFVLNVLWIDGQTSEGLLICLCCFCVNSCAELSNFFSFVTQSLHPICSVKFCTECTYGFAVLHSC